MLRRLSPNDEAIFRTERRGLLTTAACTASMFSGIRTDNTRPLGYFSKPNQSLQSYEPTCVLRVQKELERGAESHSQLQIFPFLCATLYFVNVKTWPRMKADNR
jgi:hypothetical protein